MKITCVTCTLQPDLITSCHSLLEKLLENRFIQSFIWKSLRIAYLVTASKNLILFDLSQREKTPELDLYYLVQKQRNNIKKVDNSSKIIVMANDSDLMFAFVENLIDYIICTSVSYVFFVALTNTRHASSENSPVNYFPNLCVVTKKCGRNQFKTRSAIQPKNQLSKSLIS